MSVKVTSDDADDCTNCGSCLVPEDGVCQTCAADRPDWTRRIAAAIADRLVGGQKAMQAMELAEAVRPVLNKAWREAWVAGFKHARTIIAPKSAIANALVEHGSFRDSGAFRPGPGERWFCSCGQMIDEEPSGRDIARRHRNHIAEAIATLVND